MNKYFCLTLSLVLSLLLFNCGKSFEDTTSDKVIHFSAYHQPLNFEAKIIDEKLYLKDNQNKTYELKHTPSASGTKYTDGTYEFWTKGNDFIWSKSSQIICKGSKTIQIDTIVGDYGSDSYLKRKEGYDWVGVRISKFDENKINIKIRSRVDKKKPTCTADMIAFQEKNGVFHAFLNGAKVLFTFQDNTLDISSENGDALAYYCSGGGSMINTYQKLDQPLDKKQVDQRTYTAVESLFDITFFVSANNIKGKQIIEIQTNGLKYDETLKVPFDGTIVQTYVEDLNLDVSPELIIVGRNDNNEGVILAYSTNNKKSISQVYFPPINDDKDLSTGYMGNDDFSVVETTLIQRFPYYENGKTEGKVKQIQYKLKDGEASRKFVVDRVIKF
ncbi:MliC family protein [Flammeovirga pacifica]|uniref:C-type lysozyme inhibitor domain-containing protein n=1 Tax=Flammeovirga pacifica TaxID=915059 RepID=A0A1S1YSI3_FLAPC|nr:MliC family protein [Flammeovirga pacifica]OHX63994.1 hypothetical protein NH26_20500 [Flammeovirga pacifica]